VSKLKLHDPLKYMLLKMFLNSFKKNFPTKWVECKIITIMIKNEKNNQTSLRIMVAFCGKLLLTLPSS
jgi:hypothetical protein